MVLGSYIITIFVIGHGNSAKETREDPEYHAMTLQFVANFKCADGRWMGTDESINHWTNLRLQIDFSHVLNIIILYWCNSCPGKHIVKRELQSRCASTVM